MSDLTEMWAALERYQPYADKAGHGESWAVMCKERTELGAAVAHCAAPVGSAAWAAALAAATATEWAVLEAAAADRYAQDAINAIKEVQP